MKTRRILTIITAVLAVSLSLSFTAFAETLRVRTNTSEPFADEPENHLPEEEIEVDGVKYRLVDYKVVDSSFGKRQIEVSDTIPYSSVTREQRIPDPGTISIEDPLLEKDVEVHVPLVSKEYHDERWEDGFTFNITIHDVDAAAIMLGNTEVEVTEEEPLKGYEAELLESIGVSPDNYRIDEIHWSSDEYTDGNGTRCRNLTATGQMRVFDCDAFYSGMADLPEVKAQAIETRYEEVKEPEPETETEAVTEPVTEAELVEEPEPEPSILQKLFDLWRQSALRDFLNRFGLGRAVASAVDWALEEPARATVTLGSLLIIFFCCSIVFLFAFGNRRKKRKA